MTARRRVPRAAGGEGGDGLRARSRRGRIGRTWWAQRWTAVFETERAEERLTRGRALARSGHVRSLEVAAGQINADVSGGRGEMHAVRVRMEPIAPEGWDRVQAILAGRALFAARLLGGEMPRPIEEAFSEAGIRLFPECPDDLVVECDCEEPGPPCAHAAAACYLMAERLDEDPFEMFRFRGRSREEILDALRRHRVEARVDAGHAPEANGSASGTESRRAEDADAEPTVPRPDPLAALAAQILPSFAEPGEGLDDLDARIMPPPIPEAVLRRLGPVPGAGADSATHDALKRAYEISSRWALDQAARERPESAEETGEDEEPE